MVRDFLYTRVTNNLYSDKYEYMDNVVPMWGLPLYLLCVNTATYIFAHVTAAFIFYLKHGFTGNVDNGGI